MEINCTLVIQAINFGIAYVILRTLFFDPVVAVIAAEDHADAAVRAEIANAEHCLEELHEQQAAQWAVCRRYFADHAPQADQVMPRAHVLHEHALQELSPEQIQAQAHKASTYLTQRIARGK